MVLGVFGAAISAFAIGDDVAVNANPATGQPISWTPIIIGIVALLVAIICVALSKKNNNVPEENIDKDYINEDEVETGLNFFTSKKDDVVVQEAEESADENSDDISQEEESAEETDSTEE